MTEADPEELDEFDPFNIGAGDAALEMLVLAANDHGLTTGITINVKGTVISGTLVGRDQWVEAIRSTMSDHNPDEGGAAFVDEWAKRFTLDHVRSGNDDWDEEFIHLTRARYVVDSDNALAAGIWRGRLDAVDGWSWGRLSAADGDD